MICSVYLVDQCLLDIRQTRFRTKKFLMCVLCCAKFTSQCSKSALPSHYFLRQKQGTPCSKVKLPQGSQHVWARAGKVRKLAWSSRSKFKLVWHQFNTLFTIFSGKFTQLISGHWGQVPPFSPFSSVHSVQFKISSGSDSDWPAWLGSAGSVRLRLTSVHRVSNWLGGAEEQF